MMHGLALCQSVRTATAVPLSAEATALFARMTTQPTSARQTLINNAIVSLKTAGVWSKLDALYVTAAADAQAGQRNWIADAFNLSPTSSPTFTADRGYAGNGSSSYLDTNFNTSTGVNFTRDSASWSVFSRSSAALVPDGNFSTPNGTTLAGNGDGAPGNAAWRINGPSETAPVNADGSGLYSAVRTASATTALYKNGSLLQASSQTSAAPLNTTLLLGAFRQDASPAFFSTRQISAAAIGAGLTAQNALDLYNALHAYMTGVGA